MKTKMNKEQQAKYDQLLKDSQELLDANDTKGVKEKLKEIEKFENECDEINTLQANTH